MTADQRRRFEQEARAVAKLRHPGIVTIYEVGEDAGRPHLVMDCVEGETLEAALRGEGLTPRRLADVLCLVAAALDHAHQAGIVHRDVKPQNVMLDAAGRPFLMDFGLARDASAEEQLTQTGQVLGTLHYMAPEQAGARPAARGRCATSTRWGRSSTGRCAAGRPSRATARWR